MMGVSWALTAGATRPPGGNWKPRSFWTGTQPKASSMVSEKDADASVDVSTTTTTCWSRSSSSALEAVPLKPRSMEHASCEPPQSSDSTYSKTSASAEDAVKAYSASRGAVHENATSRPNPPPRAPSHVDGWIRFSLPAVVPWTTIGTV